MYKCQCCEIKAYVEQQQKEVLEKYEQTKSEIEKNL